MAADGESAANDGAPGGTGGDPRVLWVMNLVLSTLFAVLLVSALSLAGLMEFTPTSVAPTVLFLMAVTWLVVLR